MGWLLSYFTGCRHERLTRPITLNRRCYQCCVACGAELAYDFAAMKLGAELKPTEQPRSWRTELAEAGR